MRERGGRRMLSIGLEGKVDEHQYSMLYAIDWEHPIADRLGPFFFKTLRIDKGPFVFLEDNKVVKKKGH